MVCIAKPLLDVLSRKHRKGKDMHQWPMRNEVTSKFNAFKYCVFAGRECFLF